MNEDFIPSAEDGSTNHFESSIQNESARRPRRKTALPDRYQACEDTRSRIETKGSYRPDEFEPSLLDAPAEEAELHQMQIVSTLSWDTIEENGKPGRFITVMNSKDETLYRFKVWVADSKIPNGGLGCFLEFVECLVLNAKERKLSKSRMKHVVGWVPDTMEVLEAEGVNVTLTGRHLHSLFNLTYFENNFDQLDPSEYGLKDDEAIDKRFGFLKNHTLADYERVPEATFNSYKRGCGTIELGRYGALRKSDRKTKEIFDLKTYLFDHSPTEWPFEVEEELDGRPQLIDFTDDGTGEPHEDACKSLPKHVNETGHDPLKAQNVHILSREEDNRNVFYYICIDTSQTMELGQKVELLANYGETYELNRERQGYGIRNLKEGLGADTDFVAKLRRDEEDKEAVVEMVESYNVIEFMEAFIFVYYVVFPKLKTVTDPFLRGEAREKRPSKYQIVARRRVHRVASLFHGKLMRSGWEGTLDGVKNELLTRNRTPWLSESVHTELKSQKIDYKKVKDALGEFDWPKCEGPPLRQQPDDTALHNVLTDELRQESLIAVRKRLLWPLDKNLWCPLACELTLKLCDILSLEGDSDKRFGCILHEAVEAGRDVLTACNQPGSPDGLEFKGKTREVCWKWFAQARSKTFFKPSSTVDKGVMAEAAEYLAYRDTLALGFESPIDMNRFVGPVADLVFVGEEEDGSAMPRRSQHFATGRGRLHMQWYMTWQVAFVAFAFVSESSPSEDAPLRLLKTLCQKLGIDYEATVKAVKDGMTEEVGPFADASGGPRSISRKRGKARKRVPTATTLRMASQKQTTNRRKNLPTRKPAGERKRKRGRQSPSVLETASKPTKKRKNTGKGKGGSSSKGSGAPSKSKKRNFLFWTLVWPRLMKEAGWTLDTGNRPTDYYFMPPNVLRHRGFSNRKDYFDSVKQVLDVLEQHEIWSADETCKDIVRDCKRCAKKLDELAAQKQVPKEMTLLWLRSKLD